jgi:putative transposase
VASHVFHQLYYHFVWSTKDRLPLITDEVKEQLVQAIANACQERGVTPIACNSMPDHVHLFVQLQPTTCVATFIGQIKGASAYTHNRRFGVRHHLKWQDGYGVVTVREAETEKVVRYIVNQQQLHETRKTSWILEATEFIQ